MLVEYRNNYQKIALGLLSYVPKIADYQDIHKTLNWYLSQNDRRLFLWKNEVNNFTGIIGIQFIENYVLLRIIVMSAQENRLMDKVRVLNALQDLFSDKKILGTMENVDLITQWEHIINNEEHTNE